MASKAAIDGGIAFGSWTCFVSFTTTGALFPFRRGLAVCVRVGMITGFEGVAAGTVHIRSGFDWVFLAFFGTILALEGRVWLFSCSTEGEEVLESVLGGVAWVYERGTIMFEVPAQGLRGQRQLWRCG